ncbi:ornithine cyclodeaminase family protein [Nocardiopsis sp. CT-R113]|uniref:Ornithine cyclodeaminase family protein n=1 Tax=Nocardiopsis codii TaxID=3065942 RepID=A0ABU7K0K4_9ACTN|nr:ornithine cyclodeaminase family protein [Nocardiopsis sp. CT-R113]MEE2035793.1 ornithine cyclodeaminase family protein [Nocardiopsis sp. CT-R113]
MNPAPTGLPLVDAEEVRSRISPSRARKLIEAALLDGFDPADDPARSHAAAGDGHLLLMPSTLGGWVGVKIASVSPDNPGRGLPRIQAVYMLMDARTLTPRLLVDGVTLTSLRTPATSAVAADRLAAPDATRLVVFGNGPQAISHTVAIAEIRDLTSVRLVGRTPHKVEEALTALAGHGITAEAGTSADVADADIVVCATSAAEPLFDGSLVRDGACVVAIGSHEPDRRELDAALMGRSLVVVEERGAALRECGDVVLAIGDGTITAEELVGLAPLVRGEEHRRTDRPNVFKGSGMSWQDLAVAVGVAPTG